MFFLELLARTVHSSPQLLLDSMSKIREVLDYLSFLPSTSSRQLLISLLPLLKISMPLKDSLMLVLRKALFSRYYYFIHFAYLLKLRLVTQFRNGGASFSPPPHSIWSTIDIILEIDFSAMKITAFLY